MRLFQTIKLRLPFESFKVHSNKFSESSSNGEERLRGCFNHPPLVISISTLSTQYASSFLIFCYNQTEVWLNLRKIMIFIKTINWFFFCKMVDVPFCLFLGGHLLIKQTVIGLNLQFCSWHSQVVAVVVTETYVVTYWVIWPKKKLHWRLLNNLFSIEWLLKIWQEAKMHSAITCSSASWRRENFCVLDIYSGCHLCDDASGSKNSKGLLRAFYNIFEKKLKPEKTQRLKYSTIFQAKTQQSGSYSSQMNFKTHFIFNTFAVNEQLHPLP